MRSHGVPNFPDPSFNGDRIAIRIQPGTGINPGSPAFKHAQAACAPLIKQAVGLAKGG
jgi:hypothetical protein